MPQPSTPSDADDDRKLLDLIRRRHAAHPSYGVRTMTAWLHSEGRMVNHKRVRRLMKLLGLKGSRRTATQE
jgi:putative transposase